MGCVNPSLGEYFAQLGKRYIPQRTPTHLPQLTSLSLSSPDNLRLPPIPSLRSPPVLLCSTRRVVVSSLVVNSGTKSALSSRSEERERERKRASLLPLFHTASPSSTFHLTSKFPIPPSIFSPCVSKVPYDLASKPLVSHGCSCCC